MVFRAIYSVRVVRDFIVEAGGRPQGVSSRELLERFPLLSHTAALERLRRRLGYKAKHRGGELRWFTTAEGARAYLAVHPAFRVVRHADGSAHVVKGKRSMQLSGAEVVLLVRKLAPSPP